MPQAVCLVSGGLDSSVAAAMACAQGLSPAFLHVTYGQLTARREERAFQDLADHYQVRQRLVVDISHLSKIGGSALTDPDLPLPAGALDREGIPISYVPFRNANLLAIATSWAEVIQADFIFVGAVEEDSSGYPDCREAFFRAFNRVIREGTRPDTRIEIRTPLIRLLKRQIILQGVELEVPFQLTWSCYQREEEACGTCDSCLLRLRGFEQAGLSDPIPYLQRGAGS